MLGSIPDGVPWTSLSPTIANFTISATPRPKPWSLENADAAATIVAAEEPNPAPSGTADATDTFTRGLMENSLPMASITRWTGRSAGDWPASLSDTTLSLDEG